MSRIQSEGLQLEVEYANQSSQEIEKQGSLYEHKEERGESNSMQAEEKGGENESKQDNNLDSLLKSLETERTGGVPNQKPVFDEVQ